MVSRFKAAPGPSGGPGGPGGCPRVESGLRHLPERMRALPRDRHYRPVPWFVDTRGGTEAPDFRVVRPAAVLLAISRGLCWVCGQGRERAAGGSFVIGPMCALNRTTAEPPSHIECALWSAKHCPFLSRPQMKRRTAGMPEARQSPGVMIERNPGVALVWTTARFTLNPGPLGLLFDIGEPRGPLHWLREGRPATRAEILDSIDSGLPILRSYAEGEQALADVEARYARALQLVPA